MSGRKWLSAALGVVLVGLTAAPSTGTDEAFNDVNRTTYLTFNAPVLLPGVTLRAGTYIFELADPFGAWDLVRVSSHDRRHVYLTTFTRIVPRPHDLAPGQRVSVGEVAANAPQPITAWWPTGERTGREFIY